MANINQQTIYRTSQGKQIDLNKLINQNELTLAVGNKKVNARGDLIGQGGQIIKKYEENSNNGIIIPDQIRSKPQTGPVEPIIQEDQTAIIKPKSKNIKGIDTEGAE